MIATLTFIFISCQSSGLGDGAGTSDDCRIPSKPMKRVSVNLFRFAVVVVHLYCTNYCSSFLFQRHGIISSSSSSEENVKKV